MKINPLQGAMLVTLSGILFGLLGYLGLQLMHLHFSVENMLFWRFLLATMWIICVIAFAKEKLKFTFNLSITKIFIFSTLTYAGGSIFYFLAAKEIGIAVAMTIFFSFPIFVTFFSWLFDKSEVNLQIFLSLFAVLGGLVLLKNAGTQTLSAAGVIYGLLAAFCYASYVYSSRDQAKSVSASLLTLLVCGGNTIFFFVYSVYDHTFMLPGSTSAWVYICLIGIVATAWPIQLLLEGLRHISPVKASILSVLEPLVTVVIGLVLLDEKITSMQSLGMVIILAGAIFIQFERNPQRDLEDKSLNETH